LENKKTTNTANKLFLFKVMSYLFKNDWY